MNKHERFGNALAGREVDYVPSGFWLHFPEDLWEGEAAVKAHIDFYRETDVDVLKVMNEYRYRMPMPVESFDDWARWKPISVRGGYYQSQIDLLKAVADKLGHEVPILATIHGVYISAFHGSRRPDHTFDMPHLLTHHMQQNPKAVMPALEAVTDTLIELSHAFLDAGATGILYSSIGGESFRFDEETFSNHLKPHEMRILDEVGKRTDQVVLHICKAKPRFAPYVDYRSAAVNWAVHESDLSMREGQKMFGRSVLGGLDDRSGVLVDGSIEQIEASVGDIVAKYGKTSLILGADCTLPTDISRRRIRTAVDAARNLA